MARMRMRALALALLGSVTACGQPAGEANQSADSNATALGEDALILNDAAAANAVEPLAAERVGDAAPRPAPPPPPPRPAAKAVPKAPPPAPPPPPPDPHAGHDMDNMSEAEMRNMSD